jgi:hypothetical protein
VVGRALHPEKNEGFGGGSATDAGEDGALVSLPPELRCTAL